MLTQSLRARQRRSAGMSLVELLVGMALGLFIIAGVTLVTGTQLGANRQLLVETQIQQDLRAAADIVARDLRRAGYWGEAFRAAWSPALGNAAKNPHTGVNVTGSPSNIDYRYSRGGNDDGPFGFRLQSGVLQTQVSLGNWQALTDSRTMLVTEFSITPSTVASTVVACAKACNDGTSSCWPQVITRDYAIVLSGRAVSDSAVERTLLTTVSVRNDVIDYRNANSPTTACPP